jgi:hypothetical protein
MIKGPADVGHDLIEFIDDLAFVDDGWQKRFVDWMLF